jgi:hypothetical protein
MTRRRQLIIILGAVLVLSSALSHLAASLLDIRADKVDRGTIDGGASGEPALILGSSLTFFGITWREVAKTIHRPLVTRSVGGCSPCELETLAREVPEAARTVIGVSLFDLNENSLSDSRPLLVPIQQTVRDIFSSGADWPYAKRVLWGYPLPWLRKPFPVAGCSTTVMVNLREKARALLKRQPSTEPEAKLTFKTDEEVQRPEKLSDWDPGRVARNLSQLRASSLATGRFDGPKALALARILGGAAGREQTVMIVFPVSPPYRDAFVDASADAEFEAALARAQSHDARLRIIRLDREPALQTADVFWDLVHLNDSGRRIATRLVIAQIAQ